jgi:hypothetical protein
MPSSPAPPGPRAVSDERPSRRARALDALIAAFPAWDSTLYTVFTFGVVLYVAAAFYGYMLFQTGGTWSAPLDDVFIHFDYARATARGYPFQWVEGNGYSSGNTSLTYPFVLALGYAIGFKGLTLMVWAAVVAAASTVGFLVITGALLAPLGRWAKYLLPPAVLSLGALDWTLFSGMENALHLAIWAGFLAIILRLERAIQRGLQLQRLGWAAGACGVVLFFTRPESVVCIAASGIFVATIVLQRGGTKRQAFLTLVRVGLPAALALVLQMFVNRSLTGEWSANGAIAKLAINNPYMTATEKWEQYKFLLSYVVLRNTQHHFADVLPWGWLVPAVALVPLAIRSLRRYAILLWVQVIAWLAIVSMNGQVRWQNERYTMAAVAWLMVLATMGLAAIASSVGPAGVPRAARGWLSPSELVARLLRVSIAAGLAGLYWLHQAPNFRDQVWFFGRASRNIRDQHIVAGTILAQLAPKRVLVGDAGALMYASDRPGLDLIGLGGYHKLPFARAGLHGLGASLELIERMPSQDRPDVMAIYPSWWGSLPGIFGRRFTEVVVTGNVICGGASKVLYRADWSALEGSNRPRSLQRGEVVVDELDVADLVSERDHDYGSSLPRPGFVDFRVLADPAEPQAELFDAGRSIPAGQRERARLRMPARGGRLIARAARGPTVQSIAVRANGRELGRLAVPHGTGFYESSVALPPGLPEKAELELAPEGADWMSFHVWIVAPPP